MSGEIKMLVSGTQGCLRSSIGMLALGAAGIALAFGLHLGAAAHPAKVDAAPVASLTPFIEVHSHFGGKDPAAAIEDALRVMPIENCAKVIFMPSPFAAEQTNRFDDEFIMAAEKDHRDKFAFLGGGGTLNVMIQQSVESGDIGPEIRKKFKQRAEQIMKDGASGFGEMTAEHFAMNANGFYEYAPPDHPLFLSLIDISAEHHGAPISLHMEAVSKAMPIPPELASFHNNAPQLHANIPAFERLLSHNPHGNIVWAHEGWDNTGDRTVALSRRLLKAHPNLYMEIKIDPVEPGKTTSLRMQAAARSSPNGSSSSRISRTVL